MKTGLNIKNARIYRGLTQKELAERCKLATGTIQQYELNKRKPKIEQVMKIANALDLGYTMLDDGFAFYDFVDTVSPSDSPAKVFNEKQNVLLKERFNNELVDEMYQGTLEIMSNENKSCTSQMLVLMNKLNDAGQSKAIEQVDLLTKIPEYRKDSDQ